MNHFEFIDPSDTLARHLQRGRHLDAGRSAACSCSPTSGSACRTCRAISASTPAAWWSARAVSTAVVPLENASMPGRVVVQWDKDDCAEMGIIKVDLLGLGMMAVLQDTMAMINRRLQAPGYRLQAASTPAGQEPGTARQPAARSPQPVVDLAHLPPDDPAVYRMLQAADTIGVFQVESRAQMAMLPRMKPDHFYDLVVQVAIIRPGPIVGQMVHPYLNRRAGREAVEYPHPSLEPILKRTLGVPLFQEQLLRMAMTAAGFTGGQAEELRRAMGFKRSEKRMRQIEVQLREGMARNGIEGDAGGGDHPVDHVVCALRVPRVARGELRAARLRERVPQGALPGGVLRGAAQQPADGVLSSRDAGEGRAAARRPLPPIDVQVSDWECPIEPDGTIRLGFLYVNGLREDVGRAIAAVQPPSAASVSKPERCPKCGCDDAGMIESRSGCGLRATGYRRCRAFRPDTAYSLQPAACSLFLQRLRPRLAGAGAGAAAVPDDRGSDPPHGGATRRARGARGDRCAQLAGARPARGVVAGRARGAARGRAVRGR